MNLLKINNGKAEYLLKDGTYKDLSLIDKADIKYLITQAIENEESTFEEYDEEKLHNSAHKVIYELLTKKIKELIDQREDIINEKNNMYKNAMEKYGNNTESESDE